MTETLTGPKSYSVMCFGNGGTATDEKDVAFESPSAIPVISDQTANNFLQVALFAFPQGRLVEGAGIAPSRIGATGKIGEDALKALGGESQKFFKTPLGGRRVDQFTIGDTANESKVGYQSLTATTKIQIAKDTYLIKQGTFADDVWHFFQSPITGLIGASKPLLQALKDAGISVFVHK